MWTAVYADGQRRQHVSTAAAVRQRAAARSSTSIVRARRRCYTVVDKRYPFSTLVNVAGICRRRRSPVDVVAVVGLRRHPVELEQRP